MNLVLKSCVIWPLPIPPASVSCSLCSVTLTFSSLHSPSPFPTWRSLPWIPPCSHLSGISPPMSPLLHGWLTSFGSQLRNGVTVTVTQFIEWWIVTQSIPYPNHYHTDLFYFLAFTYHHLILSYLWMCLLRYCLFPIWYESRGLICSISLLHCQLRMGSGSWQHLFKYCWIKGIVIVSHIF